MKLSLYELLRAINKKPIYEEELTGMLESLNLCGNECDVEEWQDVTMEELKVFCEEPSARS